MTFCPFLEVVMTWIAGDQVSGVTPQGDLFIRSVVARFCDNHLSFDEFRSALVSAT
jgi:hypothetical protein